METFRSGAISIVENTEMPVHGRLNAFECVRFDILMSRNLRFDVLPLMRVCRRHGFLRVGGDFASSNMEKSVLVRTRDEFALYPPDIRFGTGTWYQVSNIGGMRVLTLVRGTHDDGVFFTSASFFVSKLRQGTRKK